MTDEKKRDEEHGLSRRSFLRGSAAAGLAPLLAGGVAAAQEAAEEGVRSEAGATVLGPGPVPVKLRINGEVKALRLEPRVTLLDALRQDVGLTGAKRVCDRGTCGACTVLVDGDPVYACSLLAVAAQGQEIETVESLGSAVLGGAVALHPLQAAFVRNDAQQCGFCTPGFVVAAKALLDRNPSPTPDEVVDGLSGNFCRCGTYAGIEATMAEMAAKAKGGGDA